MSFGTGVVIALLMWGECRRLALNDGLEQWGVLEPLASEAKFQFWLVRELCRWWTVSVMLAVLGDLVCESPIVLHFRRVIRPFITA